MGFDLWQVKETFSVLQNIQTNPGTHQANGKWGLFPTEDNYSHWTMKLTASHYLVPRC